MYQVGWIGKDRGSARTDFCTSSANAEVFIRLLPLAFFSVDIDRDCIGEWD
jgi:hypothetical protein